MYTGLIKVCLLGGERIPDFYGYDIHSFDPLRYFQEAGKFSLVGLARDGLKSLQATNRLYSAEGVDRLYRQKDPAYMALVGDFVDRFREFDIIILSSFNPIHPEVLHNECRRPVKILGFIDDPFSSYVRGIPYLWAFDGAFYISPSYDEHSLFEDKLLEWGCKATIWWPLVTRALPAGTRSDDYFADRDIDLLYIGKAYGDKIDRLRILNRHFGRRFRIHGRWPLGGYAGVVRGLAGKPVLWRRVRALTGEKRTELYERAKIGFNLHLSTTPRETGNMRMYEVAGHGAMLLSDKAGLDAHNKIYQDEREAIYYDSLDDAIGKIEFYLENDEARLRIARAGYKRTCEDYAWSDNLKRVLDWARSLKTRKDS